MMITTVFLDSVEAAVIANGDQDGTVYPTILEHRKNSMSVNLPHISKLMAQLRNYTDADAVEFQMYMSQVQIRTLYQIFGI
jgi:hypothetical protein